MKKKRKKDFYNFTTFSEFKTTNFRKKYNNKKTLKKESVLVKKQEWNLFYIYLYSSFIYLIACCSVQYFLCYEGEWGCGVRVCNIHSLFISFQSRKRSQKTAILNGSVRVLPAKIHAVKQALPKSKSVVDWSSAVLGVVSTTKIYNFSQFYSIGRLGLRKLQAVFGDPDRIRIQKPSGSGSVFGIRIHTCKYRIKCRQKM